MNLPSTAAATFLLPLVLAACAAPNQGGVPAPSPPGRDAAARPAPALRPDVGLVPLPSRRQVVDSVALGRRDPFASVLPPPAPPPATTPAAGAQGAGTARGPGAPGPGGPSGPAGAGGRPSPSLRPGPPGLPPGFRLAGVIRSGGRSEAVVVVDDPQGNPLLSGNLRPGDRGGRTTDLLPLGWSVASIDVNRGSITLLRGARRVVAEL